MEAHKDFEAKIRVGEGVSRRMFTRMKFDRRCIMKSNLVIIQTELLEEKIKHLTRDGCHAPMFAISLKSLALAALKISISSQIVSSKKSIT